MGSLPSVLLLLLLEEEAHSVLYRSGGLPGPVLFRQNRLWLQIIAIECLFCNIFRAFYRKRPGGLLGAGAFI